MNEMTLTMQEIADGAENTFSKMLSAHEQAEHSQTEVNASKEKTLALQTDMDHACKVITQLDGDIHAIEAIIGVIESLADQTNLLALNAAKEADRAGKQGRNSVVADEVRTLAARTRSSTEEIRSNIAALLKASVQAVDAIHSAQERTLETASSAEHVNTGIKEVVSSIATIKDLNMQIATAAEEQTRTTEEMNKNIVRIADLAEPTAELSTKSSGQMVELHKSSESGKYSAVSDGTFQVAKNSPNLEAAQKVLQFTATKKFAELFAKFAQQLPANGSKIDMPLGDLNTMATLVAEKFYSVSPFNSYSLDRGELNYNELFRQAIVKLTQKELTPTKAWQFIQDGLNSWNYVGSAKCK
ncbi:methyl-accepting chemotaxis protein [Saccharophagus degradans]|uniref:methyl-accepting chemotaxis protein n=1 Tax=Saccharophagus degradans TaxID=86304 RepID=UPI002477FB5E|nr:methyl-accepting chemotaxis protein [Saccharophagus degradans]WGO97168.1 methyl-accepting chemotaxis protein [Saccharophagus degradans]